MKKIYILYKPYIEALNLFTIILILFCLPLFKKAIAPLIAFWILTWLLEFNFKKRFTITNKVAFFSLVSFYVLNAISLLYTNNLHEGLFYLEVKLSLIIFPCIFLGVNKLYTKYFDNLLGFFVIANIVAISNCLFHAVYQSTSYDSAGLHFQPTHWSQTDGAVNYFYYGQFSRFLHSAYFSMYIGFCIIIIFYFIDNKKFQKLIWLQYFLIPFFLLAIYLLSSKAGIISIVIVLLVQFIYYFSIKKNFGRKTVLGIIIALFIIFTYKYNSRLNYSMQQIKDTSFNLKQKDLSTSDDRLKIWYHSFDIVKQNALIGVGIGDTHYELNKIYEKYNFQKALKKNLNCHNQFLESLISTGLLGFLALLIIFISGFYYSFKCKNLLTFFFLLLTGVNFLFESMLNTQSGIVFFALFFSLLVFRNPELLPKRSSQIIENP